MKRADVNQQCIELFDDFTHGFNNDTNEERYDKEAADLAWGRTVEFLKGHLAE
jgi:carboxymethylenebutenolidase